MSLPPDTDQRWAKTPHGIFTSMSFPAVTVYGWLSAEYGGRRRGIFPSIARLSRELHTSPDTVQRALHELGKAGWITVTARPGRSSVYQLAMEPTAKTG